MLNISRRLFFGTVFLGLFSSTLFAYPSTERTALTLGSVTSQATSMILDGNRYLFLAFSDNIFRVDTETWALTTDQVPALTDNSATGGEDLTGDIAGLAIQGNTLFATQGDGDLLTINLNEITATPTTTHLIDGTLGPVVADTEGGAGDDKLYIVDKTNNAVIVYNTGDGSKISIPLLDSRGTAVTPVNLVFVPFPTDASTSTTDKIFVTTNRGLVFVINEGGTSVADSVTLATTDKELPAAAVTPGKNFLLVVNATDTSVHVMDTATDAEIDTDSVTSGTNPISLPKNGSLKSITVASVTNPDDVYAFVTGAQGVSVIDLNISATLFSAPTVLDFNDTGSTDSDDDPLGLSSIPGLILSSTDGFVYTSDSNATLSVLSDNPFVTIASTSLGTTALTTSGSFTLTFQSDETGTYRVLVGGGLTGSGTEVTTGTVDTANTGVTTASVSYDSTVFSEGTNRIFVFVTDSSGNEGRDAVDITVDTPPSATAIRDTSFGSGRVYFSFNRLDVSDIDHYNVYVDANSSTVATKTAAAGTISQPSSGDTIEARINGLSNGITYYVAVEAVDKAGNVGPRTSTLPDGTPASATPESTEGLAELTGESGCTLVPQGGGSPLGIGWLGIAFILLAGANRRRGPFLIMVTLMLILPSLLFAKEEGDPFGWSLEMNGGGWMPLNTTTRNFLGSCCDPTGNLEFGFLYRSKFGFELGAGYIGAGGRALGATSGLTSRDNFDFTMIPIENSVSFRAHFKRDQFFVPYAKLGPDYVVFRENLQGDVTQGVKFGLHLAGGVQFLVNGVEELSEGLQDTFGENDLYFTVEGRYAWVNGFGGSGVDLSSVTFLGGFLITF